MAHVYASSVPDLFAAQGFVHDQDRFWEMDVHRHTTAGRLSELFGRDQVDTDKFLRTLSWREVANDPYLGPALPSIWYQVGLHCRPVTDACPYDVTGYSFSGLPGVVIGHNSDIAWGFTNLGPDVSDLYTEQFADGGYLVDDVVEAFDTREEVIEVAGGDPVSHTVRRTRHGPLVSDVSDTYADVATAPLPEPVPEGGATGDPDRDRGKYGVALAWTALQPGPTADAILLLNRARNFEEFRSAAAAFEVPAQNLVYADVDGHVGYQAPGRIPLRRADHDGRWPVPGWDSANDWHGDIPFEQLPWELDPDDGVIVTANNAAITPAQAPWTLTHDWSAGYRAQRIVDLLAASPRSMALQDMLDLQMDDRNGFAPDLVDHLLAIDVSEEVAPARNLLEGWDFTQPVDSAPAAFFNAVWRHLLAATFHDEVPESQWPSGGARWFEVVRGLLDQPESPWWTTWTRSRWRTATRCWPPPCRRPTTSCPTAWATNRRRGAGATCTN